MEDQEQLKNLETFSYMRSLATNDETSIREIESKIAMTEAPVNKRNAFTNRLD
jgi:hypothetical protein